MTLTVRLREAGPARQVMLTGEQVRQLTGARVGRERIVEVLPSTAAGTWLLRANRLVGAVRIGDIELYLEPKVQVARLLFLLSYARDPQQWQPGNLPLDDAEAELVPALAEALCRQVDRAVRGGLRHGYVTVEAASTVLRGRLLPTPQLSRRLGQPLPLEIRYDEFTADTAENQILASALERMLRVPGIAPVVRRHLNHLASQFAGVARLPPGAPLPVWQPTRLNARLHTAMWLAELVLTGSSLQAEPGSPKFDGFLMNMAQVFESFVATALRATLPAGALRPQTVSQLDEAGRFEIRPDLTLWDGDEVVAVADTKYKTRVPVEDIYQMLAYCMAYGLDAGHLVYVGAEGPIEHVVRRSGIRIVCHELDLNQAVSDLLQEVRQIGDRLLPGGGH